MTASARSARPSALPNYFRQTDFEALFRKHPLPDEFEQTLYRWPAERIREHQERLFQEVLAHGWNNRFYSQRWRAAGIEPGDIRSLDDLPKLPVVTVYDFKEAIEAEPPFGAHQGVTPADAAREPLKIQSSGGTTGRPRPTFFGPVEWEVQAIQTARALYIQGARPGDVMQIPFTLTTANLGWCYFQACFYYLGVVPVTTGSGVVTPSSRQIELMEAWGANILGSFPEYLLHLARTAEEMGRDPRKLGLKLINTFLGPDTENALRNELAEAWGCEVYDNYGTHEIGVASFECQARDGQHFNEDTIFVEVADIDNGQPLAHGEVGNLVATALHRRYPPLIRYNLMDLIQLYPPGRCACGSELRRMGHFLGRSDDMVKLRGVNIYPMACLNAVQGDGRTTGQWLCVVDRVGEGRDAREEMTVRVEYADASVDRAALQRDLEARLRVDLAVRVAVEPVPPGSLADLTNFGREGKVRRLLDRRPEYARKY
jgi:phenylacetate-CoA ligase